MSAFLSDRLERLTNLFSDFEHEARILEPATARELRRVLKGLRGQARQMENEISRYRWNEAARQDRETRAVVDALFDGKPGRGNVVLFPDRRPAFSDGRAEPGEWR